MGENTVSPRGEPWWKEGKHWSRGKPFGMMTLVRTLEGRAVRAVLRPALWRTRREMLSGGRCQMRSRPVWSVTVSGGIVVLRVGWFEYPFGVDRVASTFPGFRLYTEQVVTHVFFLVKKGGKLKTLFAAARPYVPSRQDTHKTRKGGGRGETKRERRKLTFCECSLRSL